MPDQSRVHGAVTRLGSVLQETLIGAHPWLAEVSEETKERFKNAWLEGLESHSTGLIGDLVDKMVEDGDPPEELRKLIEGAKDPSAQFGSIIQTLFVYGLVTQIAGAMLAPFMQQVQNNIWSANPTRPLSPPDLATGVVRGIAPGVVPPVTPSEEAYAEAAKTGVQNADLDFLVAITGEPPSPQDLFEMFRRQIISDDQVVTGLQQGDTKDDWIPFFKQLVYTWATPTDFVAAAVRYQLDAGTAKEWAGKTGLDTTTEIADGIGMFELLYDIAGRPPGPEEAGRMANRGIIPWTGTGPGAVTFQQAVAESDLKTKWTDALQALQAYIPPPRMVGGLLEKGGISADQATAYWEASGVPPELAKAYVFEATQQATVQEKLLAKGEITSLYYDGIIDKAEATDLLGDLGFVGAVASDILQLTDFRREAKQLNSEVTRITNYYRTYKIDAATASNALQSLGIPQDQIAGILAPVELDRTLYVRLPSASEIGKAVQYGTLDQAQGIAELQKLGYTDYDAAIVLSATSEQTITPLPSQNPAAVDV